MSSLTLIDSIADLMVNDDEDRAKQSTLLLARWAGTTAAERQVVDDLMVCVCGYSLSRLIEDWLVFVCGYSLSRFIEDRQMSDVQAATERLEAWSDQ